MNQPIRIFPPGLVDANGRRLRLGSYVEFSVNGGTQRGEITGWAGPNRGVEVTTLEPEDVISIHPHLVLRVDEPNPEPLTIGWASVDDSDERVGLIVPLGSRDVTVHGRHPTGDTRQWAAQLTSDFFGLEPTARRSSVAAEIDMPILRRVLDEASLPAVIDILIFVVTDQTHPQPSDTASFAPLANLWLESLRYTGDTTDDDRRHIKTTTTITLKGLPHILDSVVHQVSQDLASHLNDVDRVNCVIAGGTPAMMYGTVFAASRVLGPDKIRTIQVPADWIVDGEPIEQALIEMDVADTSLS